MVEPRASATDRLSIGQKPDLVLADLHLPVAHATEASLLNEAFLRFCAGPAREAGRVFLLGDLFESWVGDDLGLADHPRETAALRALSDSGTALFYQTGNRDFLLGRAFERATGAQRLPDETVVPLGGIPTLLAHGDQYCTDDTGYQRWRRFSRNRLAQWIFLRLPAARRRGIAGGLRDDSHAAKQGKTAEIMDVNAAAIRLAFERTGVARMIHGHTHRPAEHTLSVRGKACQRIVLADWRPDRLEWLRVTNTGYAREHLPAQ